MGQVAIVGLVVCWLYFSSLIGALGERKESDRKSPQQQQQQQQPGFPSSLQRRTSEDSTLTGLLPAEASFDEPDVASLTIYLEAAVRQDRNAEVVSFVRLVGRKPEAQDCYITLLRSAVTDGNEFILRFVVENAMDPEVLARDLESLIWLAAQRGHQGPVKILLTYLPPHSTIVGPLLEFAVREDHVSLLDSLWPTYVGDDASPEHETLLWEAAFLGQIDIVCFLLCRMCTDQSSLDMALHGAVLGCHGDIVRLLLGYGASADPGRSSLPKSCSSLLHSAAANADVAVVSLLLDHGANVHVNEEFRSGPLRVAIQAGNRPVAEFLVSRGADELAVPLSTAVDARDRHLVLKLLHHGEDETRYWGMFGSLLQMVCARGDDQMARFLLNCGFHAEPDSPAGLGGNSPLTAAVSSGNHRLVELLISKGASLQRAESEFGNALQTAVLLGRLETVLVLLDHGFDLNSRRGPLPDALTLAIRRRNQRMVTLLLTRGASTRPLEQLDRDALVELTGGL